MKVHYPTPPDLAKQMALRLFEDNPPSAADRILYPGCGKAPFADVVETICQEKGWPLPEGIGIDSDSGLLEMARRRDLSHLRIEQRDFLSPEMAKEESFDYILGNPPYVSIEKLDEEEKNRYRRNFKTANGRFDLYLLFFERALSLLAEGGRITFVTPEKWEYVDAARPLRGMLSEERFHVEELNHIEDDAFEDLVTYPSITTVSRSGGEGTKIKRREGDAYTVNLPRGEGSWASVVRGADFGGTNGDPVLRDIIVRVSAGIATGRDGVFVKDRSEIPSELKPDWVYPTVSGKQLTRNGSAYSQSVFVCPYRRDGTLPPEQELGDYGKWASKYRDTLEERSCVEKGKEWYAWHENPPMKDILQPKIVFPDLVEEPNFWPEMKGTVIPRHSVYYIVPKEEVIFDRLLDYLNGPFVKRWLEANCQRADNGYNRLQSQVLKKLPVPEKLMRSYQTALSM